VGLEKAPHTGRPRPRGPPKGGLRRGVEPTRDGLVKPRQTQPRRCRAREALRQRAGRRRPGGERCAPRPRLAATAQLLIASRRFQRSAGSFFACRRAPGGIRLRGVVIVVDTSVIVASMNAADDHDGDGQYVARRCGRRSRDHAVGRRGSRPPRRGPGRASRLAHGVTIFRWRLPRGVMAKRDRHRRERR
jgi:hypothetical protein